MVNDIVYSPAMQHRKGEDKTKEGKENGGSHKNR